MAGIVDIARECAYSNSAPSNRGSDFLKFCPGSSRDDKVVLLPGEKYG